MGLQVNNISFCDIVNNKISKREFTFLKGGVRIRRKQGRITDMSNKGINKQDKERDEQQERNILERGMRQTHSQDETMKVCQVNLPIADYGQLMQLALRQGCTPEELVAQQIERTIRGGSR